MSNLPRLFRILSITAKFRLYEFAEGQSGYLLLRLLLLLFSLRHLFSRNIHGDRNVRLRLALEALGPIYIKLGQLLSTRRDFLPRALADELAALQDRVPPFSEPKVASLISERLGLPVSEVFSRLDEQPLASASIAQVHCARLLSGEEVVVKLVRPGIEETVQADIEKKLGFEAGRKMALERGEASLAKLRAGEEAPLNWSPPQDISSTSASAAGWISGSSSTACSSSASGTRALLASSRRRIEAASDSRAFLTRRQRTIGSVVGCKST